MIDQKTYCVIMAGGIGSRFWPMSRTAKPKQFLDFLGLGRTLLQQTYDRFLAICPPENILVVTNANYAELVREQLPALGPGQVLLEPSRRNTAPCVAYATEVIGKRDPDALMVVAPSDHLVMKETAFHETVRLAFQQARTTGNLITLGIMPSRPDTGYGYIQFAEDTGAVHPRVKRVKTFTEKPDHATALRFMESGDFLWNAGIFIWSVKSIRQAFQEQLPDMHHLFASGASAYGTSEEGNFIAQAYDACANISIDYGIMEKARSVNVITSEFGSSDLGTWGSLATHLAPDASGNTAVGGALKLYDCERTMVHANDGRLVVLQGLEDYIVVSTPDALLVCRKRDEQMIRRIVNDVAAENGDRYV